VDYADSQRNPFKHLPSVLVVLALHLAVGYALVTGLARKVVDVIKAPIETKIIEEIKKALPDTPPPPPPKLATPPPPFIPPPEVNIQIPVAAPAPSITTTTTVRPPPAAPPPAPVKSMDTSVVRKNVVPIGKVSPVFPRDAIKKGIEKGSVVAHVYVKTDGTVQEVRIVSANPPRVFEREVIRALSQWRFQPEPVGFIGEVEIDFRLTD
jgi:protein TonB